MSPPLHAHIVFIVECRQCTPTRTAQGLPLRYFAYVKMLQSDYSPLMDHQETAAMPCQECLKAMEPYGPGFLEALADSRAIQFEINLRRSAVAG